MTNVRPINTKKIFEPYLIVWTEIRDNHKWEFSIECRSEMLL